MARFVILTLVNDSDKDFVDKWDGDEYVVPAHGELAVPDFIAHHFCGIPGNTADIQRAKERRGDGGKNPMGIGIRIKESGVSTDEEYIVEGNKPIAKVKVVKKGKKEDPKEESKEDEKEDKSEESLATE